MQFSIVDTADNAKWLMHQINALFAIGNHGNIVSMLVGHPSGKPFPLSWIFYGAIIQCYSLTCFVSYLHYNARVIKVMHKSVISTLHMYLDVVI